MNANCRLSSLGAQKLFLMTSLVSRFTLNLRKMSLFVFFWQKRVLASFPTVFFVALKPLFLIGKASVFHAFLLKPAPFLQALLWSRQYQQVCDFSFSHTVALFLLRFLGFRPAFYLTLSNTSDKIRLSSFLLAGYNVARVTYFFRIMTADELPSRGAMLQLFFLQCNRSRIRSGRVN